MKKALPILLVTAALLAELQAFAAQDGPTLQDACDSIALWMQEETGVRSSFKVRKHRASGSSVDLYLSRGFGDYPWTEAALDKARHLLSDALEDRGRLGELYCNGVNVKDYLVRWTLPEPVRERLSYRLGDKHFERGLDNRYIALWPSHGRYYDSYEGRWKWQRASLHTTVEDLYTQSYVLKYLIPMLENAGAGVYDPRERDTQTDEIIIDNDPSFDRRGLSGKLRRQGRYAESGDWKDCGCGFADLKAAYSDTDNPFRMGSARYAECSEGKPTCSAVWSFTIPERGRYAVYVSYSSGPDNTAGARYKVNHLGGVTEFAVNQTIGGGTWIYLGTFDFDKSGSVTLDNRGNKGSRVSADAVKIGGGTGRIDRGGGVSGVPAYCEGAMYNMQWSGIDASVWNAKDDDYTNDFASRGAWVKSLRDDFHLPVDLSLGFHSNAGTAEADSTYGTLAIYTLKNEGKRTMTNGLDRMSCRRFASIVQDEVVRDIRSGFRPDWTRRELWDRSYSESRTSDVPAMILELLSHQNFEDMTYGLDPAFQFTVSRAVYKGILKYLAELYGRPWTVQPLPVRNFAVLPAGECSARLRWEPTPDASEPEAMPEGYTVYTRIDDGAFDRGTDVMDTTVVLKYKPGHVCSYRIEAWNAGGRSFPSETLCIGSPVEPADSSAVLIVNNFTEVSAPSFFKSDKFAGFDGREDSGIPYIDDISYVGPVYDFCREHEWVSDDESGFGASYSDQACGKLAGNSFDYPAMHAKVLLDMGIPFCSSSAGAFTRDTLPGNVGIIDLICGKQKDCFPSEMKSALREFTSRGHSLLVSGAGIASPFRCDSTGFASGVLGFKWISSHGSPDGKVGGMQINRAPDPLRYRVENPDGLGLRSGSAALASGTVVLRYDTNSIPAAVHFFGNGYRVASYGFPPECLRSDKDFRKVMKGAIRFLRQ